MSFQFDFTKEKLAKLIPSNPYVDNWHNAMITILPEYKIDTLLRVSAFIAQTMHESNNFKILKENLNYKAVTLRKVFPKYFPNDQIANQYAHNQEMIANKVYGGRMGNGLAESGDGYRYCGRGLIQLTGKENYTKFAESIDTPVQDIIEYLGTFEGAIQSACWFWETNDLNKWADQQDMKTLTKKINGGLNGFDERVKNYQYSLQVLGG